MPRHAFILFKHILQEKKKNIQGVCGGISKDRTIDSEDYSHKLHSAAGVITVEDIKCGGQRSIPSLTFKQTKTKTKSNFP